MGKGRLSWLEALGSSKTGLKRWWESLMWDTLQESLGKNVSARHSASCFTWWAAISVHAPMVFLFFLKKMEIHSYRRRSRKTCVNMFKFLYWWLSHWYNLLAHILDLIGNVFGGCGLFTAWLPDRRISESAWTTVLPDASDSFWSSCILGRRNCCRSALLWIFDLDELSYHLNIQTGSPDNATPKKG